MKLTKVILTMLGIMTSASIMANPITPEKALALSQPFKQKGHALTLQLSAKRTGKYDKKNAAKGSNPYQSSSPYYIISRGNDMGFVIVSGDDCLPQVLGVVDEGNYDENDMPDSFRDWLNYRAEQVEYAQANGKNAPYVSAGVPSGRMDVGPLIETLWHQSSPYNDRCPTITSNGNRAVTGCVATAASQIAYYWRKDARTTTGTTTPTYSYGQAPVTSEFRIPKGTPLKWDLMQKEYSSSTPAEYKDAVAVLCAVMGMSCYLEYGPSTGGQISDMINVFKNQIGINGGTCVYKSDNTHLNMSEEQWSELLYNQMIQKRPVLYCGYNSADGGHAVVCDGYQSSTGFFHINFGWGRNYNGFFSVVDGVTGWGFNESWTGCVYDIYANKPNLDIAVDMPEQVYRGGNVNFDVTLTNNSTLPVGGIYLFTSTSSSAPTKLSTAKDSYLAEIPVGASRTFSLTVQQTSASKTYYYITDANLNILQKGSYTVEKSSADLRFCDLTAATSSDVEELDGKAYSVVYNPNMSVTASIANPSSHPYYGGIRLDVYEYNEETKAWDSKGAATSFASIEADAEADVTFSLSGSSLVKVQKDKYYYALVSDSISSSSDKVLNADDEANIVRFVIRANDMSVVSFENNVLKLSGHFDPTAFSGTSFAKKAAYSTAVAYDLTECQGVSSVTQDVNPNALYYVSADSKAEGDNIVKDGRAERLVLTPGYDFQPQCNFTVGETVMLGSVMNAAQWYMLTTPTALNIHKGMVAREIKGHYTSAMGLSNKTNNVTTLEAGKTYLVMTSSSGNTTLTGGESAVAMNPVENMDTTIIGTYVNTVTERGGALLNVADDGVQYLQPVSVGTEVEALRGYMRDPKVTIAIKTYSSSVYDRYYITLARDIDKAYELLDKYNNIASSEAKEALMAEIKTAEDVFSYRADDADKSAINPADDALLAACAAFLYQMSPDVNVNLDCTDLINNPSFEKKTLAGWKLTPSSTTAKVVDGTTANANRGVGLDGNYLLSNVNPADSTSVGISQAITGLTPGYYRLSAKVATGANRTVTVFAGDSTVTVPAHAFGSLYLTDAVLTDVIVKADAGSETGTLVIGVKAGDWYKADDFRLTYLHSLDNTGDVNGDGVIDVADVNAVISVICGTVGNTASADVNGDGVVDVADVNAVITIICGN